MVGKELRLRYEGFSTTFRRSWRSLSVDFGRVCFDTVVMVWYVIVCD